MSPIHDHELLLLLAVSLAAKRRPAEPAAIVAAVELIHGGLPSAAEFAAAFASLDGAGLIAGGDDGVGLTPAAEQLIEALPRRGDSALRLAALRGLLSGYNAATPEIPVVVDASPWLSAIQSHRAAAAGPAANLLMPKPKPETQSRPGQRARKPMPKSGKARQR
jgi:hypothetical protein